MSYVPNDLKYTENHEWLRVTESYVEIGITDYAQEAMGEIVFIELPGKGEEVAKGGSFGAVESTKSVSDIYSPVSGEIIEVNQQLLESPETINKDPYGDGWIIRLGISDRDELKDLLTCEDYTSLVDSEIDK